MDHKRWNVLYTAPFVFLGRNDRSGGRMVQTAENKRGKVFNSRAFPANFVVLADGYCNGLLCRSTDFAAHSPVVGWRFVWMVLSALFAVGHTPGILGKLT